MTIDQVPTGAGLAAALDAVDLDLVADPHLASVLAGYQRMASWASLGAATVAAEIARRVDGLTADTALADDAAAHEVALALGWSRPAAARLVHDGQAYRAELALVADRLRDGTLTMSHTRVLTDRLADLPPEVCDDVLAELDPLWTGRTPGQLGRLVDQVL